MVHRIPAPRIQKSQTGSITRPSYGTRDFQLGCLATWPLRLMHLQCDCTFRSLSKSATRMRAPSRGPSGPTQRGAKFIPTRHFRAGAGAGDEPGGAARTRPHTYPISPQHTNPEGPTTPGGAEKAQRRRVSPLYSCKTLPCHRPTARMYDDPRLHLSRQRPVDMTAQMLCDIW